MANTPNSVSIAFWTYVVPMTATRAMKLGLAGFVLLIFAVIGMYASGGFGNDFVIDALYKMRQMIVMGAVPVGAVLLSEIPLRDGITHKTLLYPLLGPVPRITLALVRIVTTALVLAIGAIILVTLVRFFLKQDFGMLPREILSVTLGSFAYMSLFSLVHLFNKRGLIFNLVVLFMFDLPAGRLPFSLRNISPSYHVGVIAGQEESMQLPISFGTVESSVLMSSVVLIGITVLFMSATAYFFKRKNLGDLC
jgi:hypothetical protein